YGMCLAEELETGWYRGGEIDLSGFVHELICLALPVKPLCREECAGLCPRCGVDRNAGACGCPEPAGDSPFAVLKALRDGTGGGRRRWPFPGIAPRVGSATSGAPPTRSRCPHARCARSAGSRRPRTGSVQTAGRIATARSSPPTRSEPCSRCSFPGRGRRRWG